MMMTLSLSFTYKRVIPSQSLASRTRAPRMAAGTRGEPSEARRAVCRLAPVGGDGPRGDPKQAGASFSGTTSGVRERATEAPVLRAITRVEGMGTEGEPRESAVEAPEAGGSGEKKLKDNQIQLPE